MGFMLTTPFRRRRLRIWLLLSIVAVCLLAAVVVLRRADITDPSRLAEMPVRELRDAEVVTLMRAAFRQAKKIDLKTEIPETPGDHSNYRNVSTSDPTVLNGIADCFDVGDDRRYAGYSPYPGVIYMKVEFTGPYQPNFTFSDDNHIFCGNREIEVPTTFVQKLADVAGIKSSPFRP